MGVPGALWRLWAASTPAIGANCFSCPYLYMVLAPMGGQYAGHRRQLLLVSVSLHGPGAYGRPVRRRGPGAAGGMRSRS